MNITCPLCNHKISKAYYHHFLANKQYVFRCSDGFSAWFELSKQGKIRLTKYLFRFKGRSCLGSLSMNSITSRVINSDGRNHRINIDYIRPKSFSLREFERIYKKIILKANFT